MQVLLITMKRILTIFGLAGCLAGAHAQGTLQFAANLNGANEIIPNSSLVFGTGTFSLNGNSLAVSVLLQPIFAPTSAGIYFSAIAGQAGPLQFDLGNRITIDPTATQPAGIGYFSTLSLNNQQITDLENGHWYVNVLTAANPGGEVAGAITPVPEPTTLVFLVMGAMGGWIASRKCRPA